MSGTRHVSLQYGRSVIDFALSEIFSAETDAQERQLKALIVENQAMGGTINAFRFEGQLVATQPPRTFFGTDVAPLNAALVPAYKRHKASATQLNKDILRLRNALSSLLSKCRTLQDLRDALPDVIANKHPDMKSLPRFNEEGFVLKDRPQIFEQYKASMDLAFKYQANRLFD